MNLKDPFILLPILLAVFLYISLVLLFMNLSFIKKGEKATLKKISAISFEKLEKELEEKLNSNNKQQQKKEQINALTGKKQPFLTRIRYKVFNTVKHENNSIGFIPYFTVTIILTLVGLYIGHKLNNIFISLVLGMLGTISPYLILIYRIKVVNKDKDNKLLIVMANLTSAIFNTDTFDRAVDEILSTIPQPLYKYFKFYRDNVILLNSDKIEAMQFLAESVNNHYFNELIQMGIQYELGESGLKYTMRAIPEDYKRFLDKNKEYETIIHQKNIEFITMCVAFPFILGFIRIVNVHYYEILINNIIGKILLCIVLLIFIVCAYLFKKYNGEIKLEL